MIKSKIIQTTMDSSENPLVLVGYYYHEGSLKINFLYVREEFNWENKLKHVILNLISSLPSKIKKLSIQCMIVNNENMLLKIFDSLGFIIGIRYIMEINNYKIPEYHLPFGFSFVNYTPKLDRQFVRAFYDAFRDTVETRLYSELKSLELTKKTIYKKMINRYLVSKGWIFGIEKEGKIIGFAMLKSELNNGFINAIGVIPEYQGQGLGKILMYEAMRRLKSSGFSQIRLSVTKSNKKAYELYKSLNFRKVGAFLKGYKYI